MAPRVLGAGALLALGLNGVVGVGIFFLPATLASRTPGAAGLATLLLTALALSPVAFTFAALARRFDQDGGPVLYARSAFGDRTAYLVGWIAYLSALASTAAVIAGLCHYSIAAWFHLEGPSERAAAASVGLVLAALAALGLRFSARVWSFLTILKLTPLLGLVALSFLFAPPSSLPWAAPSLSGGTSAALAATFAFQGFEIVPLVAGHAQGSDRAIPRAMVGSLLIAAFLYALLHRACLVAVPELATSQAPLAEAAGALGGAAWGSVLGAGTNLSALGIAFGMVAMTPRYLAALGPDLGATIAQENTRGVPLRAAGITAALVSVLLLLGSLGELFVLSSVAVLAQYGVTALALLRLASQGQQGLRWRDAWPAPFALLATAVLVSGATKREALLALGAIAVGVGLRWGRRSQREPR